MLMWKKIKNSVDITTTDIYYTDTLLFNIYLFKNTETWK